MAGKALLRVAAAAAGLLLLATIGRAAEPVSPATQPTTTQTSTAATNSSADSDLTKLSLDDLMNVEVTSVSKQIQKISEAPAAVTVIEQKDIVDSGLNSIPELLRLVPGMDVAQSNADRWAITTRGLNGAFADDLLVLMDGRSVYTPVFGGVRWNAVDYPLADLDRIEAIRGPGSTLWGSNAVNGVINIETKSAKDTQGVMLDSRLSTDLSDQSARYGGQIDEDTYYRIYEKARYADSDVTSLNDASHDEWSSYQTGFRIDKYSTPQDVLTLQGDAYYQELRNVATVLTPTDHTDYENGGNLEGRWTHTESDRASTSLQVYFDRQAADDFPSPYEQDTYDIDFQNRAPISQNQELTWGLGARDSEIVFTDEFPSEYDPRHWTDYIYSAFAQDQITLIPNHLQWYFGTKLEYDRIANFQIQPGARLLWTPNEQNSIWGAVSRSVRIPSLYQNDTISLGGFAVDHSVLGPEQTLSYEVGYKVQPAQTFTADITGFYNSYRDLINYTPVLTPTFTPYGLNYNNDLDGDTYGTELSANWQVTPTWRVAGSYSLLKTFFRAQDGAGAGVPRVAIQSIEGSAPQNQYQLHSYLDITRQLQFNASIYYQDALPTLSNPPLESQKVPEHTRVDLGVAWQPRDNTTLSAGVQNLLQSRHAEFGNFNTSVGSSEIQRAYYVQCAISF